MKISKSFVVLWDSEQRGVESSSTQKLSEGCIESSIFFPCIIYQESAADLLNRAAKQYFPADRFPYLWLNLI